jgi:hypothetical protein
MPTLVSVEAHPLRTKSEARARITAAANEKTRVTETIQLSLRKTAGVTSGE